MTALNIFGLGIGLGSVILLTTFLVHEFSFDRFHSKSDQMYRVIDGKNCKTYYAMGNAFRQEIPEIEKVCRITNVSDVYTVILNRNDESYPINSFMAVDPSLFDMLDIKLLQGLSPTESFAPGSVMISEPMAEKYFGNSPVVGENLEFYIANEKLVLQVAGVFKAFPTFSSFKADFICDISVAMLQFRDLEYSLGLREEKAVFDFHNDWSRHASFTTFVLLNKTANVSDTEKKCSDIYLKHRDDLKDGGIHLQPFAEMYLHSAGLENISSLETSKFDSLRIFLSIGILILVVACMNYILIASADQEQSIKEIACRKVNGASGRQIIFPVMLKSLIVSFVSLVPAFLFTWWSLPLFNEFFEKELHFSLFFNGFYLISLLAITLITAIMAGTYLSIIALKTNPANLLQKNLYTIKTSGYINRSLIVGQFFVFIMLLSCMMIMKRQMNFSLQKDMGFKATNLMVVNLGTGKVKGQYQAIINEIKQIPHVLDCQPTTYFLPPNDNILLASFKDEMTGESISQEVIFLAAGNIDLLEIPVLDGKTFSETEAKNNNNILINEAAARKYNVNSGEKLYHFQILGVLKDFHNKSVHEAIRPILIIPQSTGFTNLIIRTDGQNENVATNVKSIIQQIEPGFYVEHELLSDRIDSFYKEDLQQTKIISFFSVIALILAFMGLFGFVTLNLTKRTKEIGIRKINGAKVSDVMVMLNGDFVKWVAIAFIIATPIAWYAMNRWLQNFAYKAELSWWIFALTGLLALGIALFTVSWQSWRAARRNPVEALRYE